MENFSRKTANSIRITLRVYVLATRTLNFDNLVTALLVRYGGDPSNNIFIDDGDTSEA
jgi:hypothetical protein